MSYRPEERDDYDYGKRIYRPKPKGKPPYLLIVTLVLVLAGLVLAILYKKSIVENYSHADDAAVPPDRGRPAVSHIENRKENSKEKRGEKNPARESSPGTNTDTDKGMDTEADKGTTKPAVDKKIFGDIEKKIFGEIDVQTPSGELFNRAHQYCQAGEFEKALPLFKKLAAADNWMSVFVGLCYYRLEDYPNARYHLEKVLATNENNVLVLKYMALTCRKLDDVENSLRYTEAALKIGGDTELQELH
ncbi:MAG: tetratricopeptide repeat protein, partial [bacterium]|nr:tetratricopeptide repeat protein [bacterium]